MSNYETVVTLPTNSVIYEGKVPKEITLRAMTTQEEKMLLGSSKSENVFEKILKACIVEPSDMDVKELVASDMMYLILKLRTHTYGSNYGVEVTCNSCGEKSDIQVNLDEFPVYELDEDFSEPIKVDLPMSGDSLEVKLLRGRDNTSVVNQAKKIAKKTKGNARQLEYEMRMAKHILTVNGEDYTEGKAQGYVNEMHARDSAFFWYVIDEVKIGMDTLVEEECSSCGNELEFDLPINREFFRPSFK